MALDVDAVAAEMRRSCGFLAHEVTGALRFATRYLGPRSVLLVSPDEVWGNGEATASGIILVRAGLTYGLQEFVIFHECAEIWVARSGLRFRDFRAKEAFCDALAAALQAPAPVFHRAVLELGFDSFAELAADFDATQTTVALRVGEVERMPVMVERPGLKRTRGPRYAWDAAPSRRVELTDGPGRAAFLSR